MGSNLYVAASGAVSRLRQLEIVANNLANSDSTGFKADRSVFQAALQSALMKPEGGRTPGAAGGVYVGMHEVHANHAAGSIERSGAPLDAAIDGEGFFVVETPAGERYTRAGSFSIGSEHRLVTPEGHTVLGGSGPLALSDATMRILADGSISDAAGQSAGRLRVVRFDDPGRLQKEAGGLFSAPAGAVPEDVSDPELVEGSLEESNVQPVVEMAVLMILQRAFDANMYAMQSEDRATERLISEVSQ